MEGSITQLGLSNYLINREGPAVSFFRYDYKNYKNYVKDTREVNFKNGMKFGQTSGFRFDEDGKFGDLVTNVLVTVELPDVSSYTNINGRKFGYCNGVGNALAQVVALRIGGNLIDQQTSEWMDIYVQLTVKPGCKDNYFSMIQKYDDATYTTTSFTGGVVYIPLQFWFCRNISSRNSSLIFPLCALYNSTIELTLDIRHFTDILVAEDGILTGAPNLEIVNSSLLIDYIILEESDRRNYISMPKQMTMINQLQTFTYDVQKGVTDTSFSLKSMRYPVIEIVFIVRRNDSQNTNDYFNYSNQNSSNLANKSNPIKTVRLVFDGSDRINTSSANYFTQLEPTKVHTNTPVNQFIHVYSFALEPEKIEQPNGICNFSELQEPMLHLSFNSPVASSTLYIYALNYNILINSNGGSNLLHMLSKSIPTIFPDSDCMPNTN
jgi:hypothetical protein